MDAGPSTEAMVDPCMAACSMFRHTSVPKPDCPWESTGNICAGRLPLCQPHSRALHRQMRYGCARFGQDILLACKVFPGTLTLSKSTVDRLFSCAASLPKMCQLKNLALQDMTTAGCRWNSAAAFLLYHLKAWHRTQLKNAREPEQP